MSRPTRGKPGACAGPRPPRAAAAWLRRSLVRAGLAALVLACAGTSRARSIEIDDFAVDVAIDESGGFDVTETLRLRFSGSWNGIIRSLPIQNVTSRGERRNLGFRFVSVTDDTGRALETERSRRGADVDLRIRVPGATDAVRTVVIRYRITGGLRFFDDHDELYWNLTGDEWSFPIHAARARITLPASLVNVRVNAFTGHHGSRERAVKIRVNGSAQGPDDAFVPAGESPPPPEGRHEIEIEATRRLDIREGLTAAVAWNPGVVRRPSAWDRFLGAWSSWFVGRPAPQVLVGLPLVAFLGMLGWWWFAGRDPRPGPLIVEYGPPDGLGPAEVGALIDNRADNRDLIAGLVDAAVKGVVRIREISPKGWFRKAAYAFELLVPSEAWVAAGISPAGCRMLRSMFTSPDGAMLSHGVLQTVTSSELDRTFHVHLKSIKDAIYADLVGRGLYRRRPDVTATGYLVFAFVCGALAWGLGALAVARAPQRDDVLSVAGPMLAGVATLVVVGAFAVVMPTRTRAGARTRDRVRGFQEFLGRVESQRLESLILTPELFEKCLPYAIALGVERRWARAFAGICTAPPTWYVGTSLGDGIEFDVGGFTDRLDVMGDTTAAVMTSVPRSSGDSGFGGGDWGGGGGGSYSGGGGGGFSGGGDGGGGGSGW